MQSSDHATALPLLAVLHSKASDARRNLFLVIRYDLFPALRPVCGHRALPIRRIANETRSCLVFAMITLKFTGISLDPSKITEALGVSPHRSARTGDVRISGSHETVSKFGAWDWTVEGNFESDINQYIARLDATFRHAYTRILNLPNAEHAWIDVAIFTDEKHESAAFVLDGKSLEVLNRIGIPVEITLYPPPMSDEA